MGDDCLLLCVDSVSGFLSDLPRFVARHGSIGKKIPDFDTGCHPIQLLRLASVSRPIGRNRTGFCDDHVDFGVERFTSCPFTLGSLDISNLAVCIRDWDYHLSNFVSGLCGIECAE